jgi:hypothetical protein
MTLQKLTPNHDLQCYFFQPSAIAALSSTSASGFTVSGTWRAQFDWAVVEWNRDNVFEHPALRNLPDGDLSGITLTYKETRTNCIALDSDLFRTVSWPFLRVWAPDASGTEQVYQVPIRSYATPVAGSYNCAYAAFTLSGTLTAGDFVGIAYLADSITYQVTGLEGSVGGVLDGIVAAYATDPFLRATRSGDVLTVYYTGGVDLGASPTTGTNGNRFAVYSFSCSATGGASTLSWDSAGQTLANGMSPTQWEVTIPFNSLSGYIDPDYTTLYPIVTPNAIRKLRWTYAADLQAGSYVRSEFQVVVSDWTVTGTGLAYSVAGAESLRFEDLSDQTTYSGTWSQTAGLSQGNYSGGTIHLTTTPGDAVTCAYKSPASHTLYLGTRYLDSGAPVSITVDGAAVLVGGLSTLNLDLAGEDVLVRFPVGMYAAGSHAITVTHAGSMGELFYFDFAEAAVPTATLPTFPDEPRMTLATDWDTEHSLALAPERTAWLMDALGFTARSNHYAGALWFYELIISGNVYATATVTFMGGPDIDSAVTNSVTVTLAGTALTKLVHMGDTVETLATAYANELNNGYMSFWGSASGNVLTIYARMLGMAGSAITLTTASSDSSEWTLTPSGPSLAGGMDGVWLTDLTASPRLNRAARDWTTSFFTALNGYGIDGTASLSMELGNGDSSVAAGIAQRGPSPGGGAPGLPILLPTPSLQTNFSPTSLAFWQEAYAEIAAIQASAGLTPFLQFGEVQWWYFATNGLPAGGGLMSYGGMPFYDDWTQAQFLAAYGSAMAVISDNTVNPASYPNEIAFLPGVIGTFTNAVMSYVRGSQPACRFEALYPVDVNQTAFNQAINYPAAAWTPAILNVLKTEAFGFTLGRDLDGAESAIGDSHGFPASQRSHLVGISESTTAWLKEAQSAVGKGFESVVLFALDQFCLIGYALPLPPGLRRSVRMGR